MFRRFAEACETSLDDSKSSITSTTFLSGMNILPSAIIHTPETTGPTHSISPIDQLLAIKNPNAATATTDNTSMYTAPSFGETAPVAPKETVDTTQPEYKKWFFDTQLTKKQMMLNTCKALHAYEDLDGNAFQASLTTPSYTSGVSVNEVGSSLLGQNVTHYNSLKPREESTIASSLMDGRLDRIRKQELDETNALTLALGNVISPADYPHDLVKVDDMAPSVKIYNMVTNPPLHLNIFKTGNTTSNMVLEDRGRMISQSITATNVVPMTRDLDVQSKNNKDFDFCSDLPDSTSPPFHVSCLQSLFEDMGGQPAGRAYPSEHTISTYNNMPNLGAVKQYIHSLLKNKQSKKLPIQFQAIMDLYGISPDSLVKRSPFQQGVEVFWFVPGQGGKVAGFLKRTIETDFVQFPYQTSDMVQQIQASHFFTMVQMTDVRAEKDSIIRFGVQTNSGFWITVNQPVDADGAIFSSFENDKKGVFSNLLTRVASNHVSKICTVYRSTLPNIMKVYYEHSNEGPHFFALHTDPCSHSSSPMSSSHYSLTCEIRAPFLAYEVDRLTSEFQELRNPTLFGQFLGRSGFEYHTRTEETMSVPGKKGFIRMSSAKSCIHLPSIAYQSWGTMTFAIRLRTMPVKETIAHFHTSGFYYSIVATRDKDGIAKIHIEHNHTKKPEKRKRTIIESCPFRVPLNTWHLFVLQNKITGFEISCESFTNILTMNGSLSHVPTEANTPLFHMNTIWNPAQPQGECNILIGTDGFTTWPSIYSTASFYYDIAWIHFFDYHVTKVDIKREANADWIYTAFPDSPYSYKVNLS
jgi:hypothetical protein